MAESVKFEFSADEKAEIKSHVAKYPDPKSAVMPALWIAQEKFGWLSSDAIELVAAELNLSAAHVHGVASFYTMYFKKKVPKHLFDICTCFTCGECGGKQVFDHAKSYLETDANGFSEDGLFWIRRAECLAACDTGPVMQVTNRRVIHKLDTDKFEDLVETLRNGGEVPPYEPVPLNSNPS